jgi:hypothetical protein
VTVIGTENQFEETITGGPGFEKGTSLTMLFSLGTPSPGK